MTTHLSPRGARVVAAAFLAAATMVVVPATPAQAAACPGSTGVTVVVDFKQLGGGVAQGCAPTGGGKTATVNFPAAGFPLAFVQRSPGFVCRVSGKPATDPCVNTPPTTAYWSLWWSDGKSGTWIYSSLGAGSLKVPTGGYLAFSWQGQAGKAIPGVTPKKRLTAASAAPVAPADEPTKSPDKGSNKSKAKDTSQDQSTPSPSAVSESSEASSASGDPSPRTGDGSPAKKAKKTTKAKAKAEASAAASVAPAADSSEDLDLAAATVDPPTSSGNSNARVPLWVAMPLLLSLVGAIAAVTVWRGRRTRALGGN